MSAEKLLSTEEVASVLGIHPRTLRVMVSEGKIGHYRIGSRIRFSEQDIRDYLHGQKVVKMIEDKPRRIRKRRKGGRKNG